jgi:hypothetical protein
MSNHTIARLYDSYAHAAQAVSELEAAGISHDHISLIANNADGRILTDGAEGSEAAPGAEIGAGLGALAGGGTGVLAGLGLLAIPGIGPVVAAGWLAALAIGAVGGGVAGGLLGGLVGSGIGKEHAETYAEGVRRGGALVSVRATADQVAGVDAILARNAVDPDLRRAEYDSEGWSAYDEDRVGLSEADIDRRRAGNAS